MTAEMCSECGKPIESMTFKGTGICSDDCSKAYYAKVRGAGMRVYISGPMRGYTDYNFTAFYRAEEVIKSVLPDAEVFSPARRDADNYVWTADQSPHDIGAWLYDHVGDEFDIREAMAADLDYVVRRATVVVSLPGIRRSSGYQAEAAAAKSVGVPVVPVSEFLSEHGYDVTDKYDDECLWATRPYDDPAHTSLIEDITVAEQATPVAHVVDGEFRSVSATGGMKGVKLARHDLIPAEGLTALAEHFGRTANKYPPNNWRAGFEWSKSYAAMIRHAVAWWKGEDFDLDPAWGEGGTPHLAAVAWHAMILLTFTQTHPEFDDRFKTA